MAIQRRYELTVQGSKVGMGRLSKLDMSRLSKEEMSRLSKVGVIRVSQVEMAGCPSLIYE